MTKSKSKSDMKRIAVLKGESMKRTDKYWICDDCAKKLKWEFPGDGITVIRGLCGYCDREDETFLTPTCDFTKPEQKVKV